MIEIVISQSFVLNFKFSLSICFYLAFSESISFFEIQFLRRSCKSLITESSDTEARVAGTFPIIFRSVFGKKKLSMSKLVIFDFLSFILKYYFGLTFPTMDRILVNNFAH